MRCTEFVCIYQCDPALYNGSKICKIEHSREKDDYSLFFCKYCYDTFSCNVQGLLGCTFCRKLFNCPNRYKNK